MRLLPWKKSRIIVVCPGNHSIVFITVMLYSFQGKFQTFITVLVQLTLFSLTVVKFLMPCCLSVPSVPLQFILCWKSWLNLFWGRQGFPFLVPQSSSLFVFDWQPSVFVCLIFKKMQLERFIEWNILCADFMSIASLLSWFQMARTWIFCAGWVIKNFSTPAFRIIFFFLYCILFF